MLAVLDPGLFQPELSLAELRRLVLILRPGSGVRLAAVDPYWGRFLRDCLSPIFESKSADRHYRDELDQLRDSARATRGMSFGMPPSRITVWGFRRLFDKYEARWTDTMVEWVAGCVLSGEDTILLTRLQIGHNAQTHGSGYVQLTEKTIWNLRVKPDGSPAVRVWCVREPRNVSARVTCRFDEGLPFEDDPGPGGLRFQPPADWHKVSCPTPIRSRESKPAWIDLAGNAWAKPNTPGSPQHWDVYLTQEVEQKYGLSPINIVRFGYQAKSNLPDGIHHVPKMKRGRLKT